MGIGQGFLGGEGLRADDEQRGFRIQLFQCLDQVCAVDIGNEMCAQIRAGIGLERFAHHQRAEIGTADADVDDVA